MNDWYSDWVQRYAATFAITDASRLTAMMAWRVPLCDYLHATQPELFEVIRRVVSIEQPPPNFANEHLAAIKRQLACVKQDAALKRERDESTRYEREHGYCADCGDSGMVVVPHPGSVKNDEWVPTHHNRFGEPIRPTCAVYCHCRRGEKVYDARVISVSGTDKPVGMTLSRYNGINPNWRWQMKTIEAAREQLASIEAQAAAQSIPAKLASGMRAIA